MNIFWILISISATMKVDTTEALTTNARVLNSTSKAPTMQLTSVSTLGHSSLTMGTTTHLPVVTNSTSGPRLTTNSPTAANNPSTMSALLATASTSKPALINSSAQTPALGSSSVQTSKPTNSSVQSTIPSKQSVSSRRTQRISTDQSLSTLQTTGTHGSTAFMTSGAYITATIVNVTSSSSNQSSAGQTDNDTEVDGCIGATVAAAIVCIVGALVVTALNITYFMVHRRRTRQTSEESLQEVKVYDFPEYIIIAKACIGHRKFDPEVLRTIDIMRDPLFDGVVTLEDRMTPELSKTVRIQSFGELTVASRDSFTQVL